jgi:hypothetical protein
MVDVYLDTFIVNVGRDSSVSIASRYWMYGPGI